MRNKGRILFLMAGAALALLVVAGSEAGRLSAKEKQVAVNPNDPTVRLFALLDSKDNGKLEDLYLLADTFNDPKNPGQQQHVIEVEYSKDRAFGKLQIHVRTVGQLTPEQLKAYSPKQIFDYAENDSAKFMKTDAGPFGKPGDVYFEQVADGALSDTAITADVQSQYDRYINQYLLPALEKKTTEAVATR